MAVADRAFDANRQQQEQTLPSSRTAGVCLHITSLPGRYGIGQIGGEARRFVDAMQRMQLGVWQFLPTGPTAYGDSPYQPLSTFAGNEMLIDVTMLAELGLLRDTEISVLESLPTDLVDYGALIPAKNRLLQIAAGRFATVADSTLKADYDDFVEYNDAQWLHDYALFRIIKSRHDERPWPQWEPHFIYRETKAMQQLETLVAGEIELLKVIQFLFNYQWRQFREYANANGIKLFGDMPIYLALDSADAWANPEILQIDRDGSPDHVAGVPPDYFSENGQLWGNPLYAWDVHAANGYSWWVERLQAMADLVDIVRVDHFRGFEAYWSVHAEAETAREGAWIPGPGDAIFDALQNELGHMPIVAEDLGVITPGVEALRDRHHIPGMAVLQFDVIDEEEPLDVAENCVCYTGTHDNDTTRGWFQGSPGDIRSPEQIAAAQQAVLKLTGGTPATIHTDLIRAAFSTDARLAIAPMQDFLGLGSEARLNTPGTAGENWRWRLQAEQMNDALTEHVASLVRESGRCLTG